MKHVGYCYLAPISNSSFLTEPMTDHFSYMGPTWEVGLLGLGKTPSTPTQ